MYGLSLSVCTNRTVMYIKIIKSTVTNPIVGMSLLPALFLQKILPSVLSKTGLLVTKLAVLNTYNQLSDTTKDICT